MPGFGDISSGGGVGAFGIPFHGNDSTCYEWDALKFKVTISKDHKGAGRQILLRVSEVQGIYSTNNKECCKGDKTVPPCNDKLYCPQDPKSPGKPKPLKVGDMAVTMKIIHYSQAKKKKDQKKDPKATGKELAEIYKCKKCIKMKTWNRGGSFNQIASLFEVGGEELQAEIAKFVKAVCTEGQHSEVEITIAGEIICLKSKWANCLPAGGWAGNTTKCDNRDRSLVIYGWMSDDDVEKEYPGFKDTRRGVAVPKGSTVPYRRDLTTGIMGGKGEIYLPPPYKKFGGMFPIGKAFNQGGRGGIDPFLFCHRGAEEFLGGADPEKLSECFNDLLNTSWLGISIDYLLGKAQGKSDKQLQNELFSSLLEGLLKCLGAGK